MRSHIRASVHHAGASKPASAPTEWRQAPGQAFAVVTSPSSEAFTNSR
ncbi:hypothetical protein ABH922_001198 [Rhodococcus sp. 27YEA15]